MSEYFDNKQLFSTPSVSQYNNHMVMTNVCKETKTKYLNIDTKFCDEYNNNWLDPTKPNFNLSNYNVTIPDRINDVKRISLMNVEIPMTFYNISSSLGNNYFKFTITIGDGTPETETIFIPDGQYTIDSLINTINSKFGGNPLINNENYYPTFGTYSNKVFLFLSQSNSQMVMDFAVDKTGEFDKYNFKSKLGWLMGFRQPSYTLNGIQKPANYTDINLPNYTDITTVNDVLFAENNYNLNVHRYFYLAIDEYSKGNQNSFISALSNSSINKNIIAKICVSFPLFPYNTVLNANKTNGLLMTDERTYTGKTDIQKLNIQLLDDLGRPVNLNGSDFSFGLKIDCE